MTTSPDSGRFRRLGRAVQAFLASQQAPAGEQSRMLAEHEEVRDLLESMLRGKSQADDPQDQAAVGSCSQFLGGFRLLREIGRGGMGIVYEAEEFALGRRVALKVLPGQPSLTARQIERFRQEAAAAARLKHQGIVPVYSVGEVDGTHYFAMEYVEGRSLGQALAELKKACGGDVARLDSARLGLIPRAAAHEAEAAELVAQAADAVAAAHAGGVLHRDLKPHNILVDRAGCVRVVDFGLAKDLVRGSVSRSGEVAGTPHYMSPEQAQGRRGLDARTDVFALGVVLYELLTLRVPFAGDTPHQVLHAISTRVAEPVRRVNPRVPRDLETICAKALEHDLRYRYRTAGELAADLRRFLAVEPISARPPGSVTRLFKLVRRRKAAALAAVLAFLVVVVGPITFAFYQRSVRAALQAQEVATALERDKAQANFARARRLLEQHLERVEQIGREPGMELMQRQMADDSLAIYQEYLGAGQASPEDAELELQALAAHAKVAKIHLLLGDHQRALAVVGAALAHCSGVPGAADPRRINVHSDLLRHRASARRDGSDLAGAASDLHTAIAQQERVLTADLAAEQRRAAEVMLAKVLFDLSSGMLEDGAGTEQAALHLERAERLLAPGGNEPAPEDQQAWLEVLRRRGEVLRRTGRHVEGEQVLRRARAVLTKAGDDPRQRAALSSVALEHGNALLDLDRRDEAEASFRTALALREELVRDFPRAHNHRHALEVVLHNLALVLHHAKRNEEALAMIQRAEAVIEELVASNPDSALYAERTCIAANLACLIETALRREDPATMQACYERTIAHNIGLIDKHPAVVSLRSNLGALRHNYGMWLMWQRRWDEGRAQLEEAIAAQQAAHEADPRLKQYRDFLYNHWQLLSQCHLARRDHAAAARASHAAAALHGMRADVQVGMAQRFVRCAALALEAGDRQAARRYEDEGLDCLTRALELEPARAESLARDEGLAALRPRTEFRALLEAAGGGR